MLSNHALARAEKPAANSFYDEPATVQLAAGKTVELKRGETIYHQQQLADEYYWVTGGAVKLVKHLPSGKARVVRLAGEGELLGVESFVDSLGSTQLSTFSQTYQHTAVAWRDVTLKVMPANSVKHLAGQLPVALISVLKALHRSLQQADQWLTEFSLGTTQARLARLLLFLGNPRFAPKVGLIELPPLQDVADMLGVTVESASRTLASFKRDKILIKMRARRGASWYQLDASALRSLA